MFRILLTFFSIFFLIGTLSQAKPKNYDECILENISKAKNNAALFAVETACENLFPKKEKPVKKIKPEPVKTKSKKFYLSNVNAKLSGQYLSIEIINDTKHFITKTILEYHGVIDCSIPPAAAILQAQRKLNSKGFNAGAADGKWGGKTKQAVGRFQKANNLEVTRELDHKTKLALGIDSMLGRKVVAPEGYYSQISPGRSKEFKFYVGRTKGLCFSSAGYADVPR